MLMGSIVEESIDSSSPLGTIKILETVIGSNHFFNQPHIIWKKDGAPMTCPRPCQLITQSRCERIAERKIVRTISLHKCDQVFLDNAMLPRYSQPACGPAVSRTGEEKFRRHQRYNLSGSPESQAQVDLVLQNKVEGRI